MKRAFQTLITICLVTMAATAWAGPVLYGANGSGGALSTLFTIDPATGAGTPIGPIGFSVTGLAFDPTTGILYGSESRVAAGPSRLMTINPTTGAGTIIGAFDPGSDETMADITFDAAGNLYGWREKVSADLYSINKATGAALLVGDSGLSTANTGLSFDNTGTLYLESVGILYRVNPGTGTVIFIGNSGQNVGLGMDVNDLNVMYALDRRGQGPTGVRNLMTVNLSNGIVTTVGPTVAGLDALAFEKTVVPEPTSLLLLGTGIVGLVARARRRNHEASDL